MNHKEQCPRRNTWTEENIKSIKHAKNATKWIRIENNKKIKIKQWIIKWFLKIKKKFVLRGECYELSKSFTIQMSIYNWIKFILLK